MAVVNQNETRADLGEVAEAGIHLPEPADALSKDLAGRRPRTRTWL